MKPEIDYSLYLVTDENLLRGDQLDAAVEQALLGGCSIVQLRNKSAASLPLYQSALALRVLTRQYRVPLMINDRADIALAVDADGLHVGQTDLPAAVARRMIGPDKILGVSAASCAEAVRAEADGADYLGVGAMFPTGTKSDARLVSFEELRRIRQAVRIPIVVIGGINARTLPDFAGSGIQGAAVVSAIIGQPDIRSAAAALLRMIRAGQV